MAMKHLPSSKVPIPYETMISLRKQGKLNLGISHDLSAQLIAQGIKPKGTTAVAYKFWLLVAIGVFIVGMYFAFTQAWWWGLAGFVAMAIIGNANKKGNSQNLLDAAMDDPIFYERVLELEGWIFQVDEDALSDIPGALLYHSSK